MGIIFHDVKIDDYEKMREILLTKNHDENRIIEIMAIHAKQHEKWMNKEEVVETSDHTPCADCGSTFFLRTGTCHVCQRCGASQGCS